VKITKAPTMKTWTRSAAKADKEIFLTRAMPVLREYMKDARPARNVMKAIILWGELEDYKVVGFEGADRGQSGQAVPAPTLPT
jgi:hypothetical protein